jgi:hypothetical protein
MGQEPVGIRRRGRPERLSQETGELEDHRTLGPDESVRDAGADLGQRELIDQFLLKVLLVLGRTQSPAQPDGSDGSKHHHAPLGSTLLRTDHEYHRSFTNHENMSNIHTRPETGEIGEYPRGTWPSVLLHELTGFGIATVQRSQGPRPTPAAGAGQGEVHPVDSLSISPREYADDDPWFGIQANPAGRITTPVQDAEPAF